MAGITRFEEIEAWKTARQLTNLIYKLSDMGTFAKDYGLKDQIRRASVSAMSNLQKPTSLPTKPPDRSADSLIISNHTLAVAALAKTRLTTTPTFDVQRSTK